MGAIGLGIDMGGTFTDIALLDEDAGRFTIAKVPSVHQDPAAALINAVRRALERAETAPDLSADRLRGTGAARGE